MNPIRTYLYKKRHRSGSVTWVVRWKDPTTGIWRAIAGGKTKHEAAIVEARVREELLKGNDPTPKSDESASLRVGKLIDLYYQGARFQSGSAHWQAVMRSRFEKVIRPALGDAVMLTLKKDQIYRFYLTLKDQGLSHKTIKQYHLCLSVLGQFYEDLGGRTNPMRDVRDFNKLFPKQPPTRDINFLTPEELERLFKACARSRSRRLQFVVRFLAGTGMRRSEALDLKWKDIDFSGGFIHVRRSKNGEPRVVPIADVEEMLELLPRYGEYVFARKDGQPFDRDSFLVPLKFAAKRAKINKRVDLHTLRHSYGSNKIRQGWGLKKVSMILGHSDISITAKVYTHLLDGDLKVRDDARMEISKSAESSADKVAQAVQELVRALQETPVGTLKNAELSREIERVVKRELQRNAASRAGVQSGDKGTLSAPQLLRDGNEFSVDGNGVSGGAPDFASDIDCLAFSKNGGPARARTWDLQIRSLTL